MNKYLFGDRGLPVLFLRICAIPPPSLLSIYIFGAGTIVDWRTILVKQEERDLILRQNYNELRSICDWCNIHIL